MVLSMIRKQVKEIDPSSNIILYGSRARGDEKPDSDWDILILVNTKVDIKAEQVFRHKLFDVELELGEAFSKHSGDSGLGMVAVCVNYFLCNFV